MPPSLPPSQIVEELLVIGVGVSVLVVALVMTNLCMRLCRLQCQDELEVCYAFIVGCTCFVSFGGMLVVVITLFAVSPCRASLFFASIISVDCTYQEAGSLPERLIFIGRVCGLVFIGQCLVITLLKQAGCAVIKKDGTVAFCEDEEESDEDPYTWPYNSSQSHHPAQKTQLFHES